MATRYTLIRGSFPVVGTEPDGDTIRFRPDNIAFVSRLGPPGQAPALSGGGTQINVRFEGIDALETHFAGTRQQAEFGELGAARMLALAGFTGVTRAGSRVTAAEPAAIRGHVLANTLDSFGRMIGFVFTGDGDGTDGGDAFLDVPLLGLSINAQLLAEGVAYPAFYTTLPVDLKDNLKAQSKLVRERALGLWPLDAPSIARGADIPDLRAAEALVMWPKLFRRLVSYFQGGNQGLAGFDAWLRADPRNRDDLLQLPTGELGNMHDLVTVTGDTVRLNFLPEDLVVLPDTIFEGPVVTPTPAPAPTPAPSPAPAPSGPAALRIVAALINPAGEDAGRETVTLINVTAAPITLDGWQLRDRQLQAAGRAGAVLSGSLAAGETLRVPLRAPLVLGNGGDDLVLVDPAGAVVQTATYAGAQAGAAGATILF